MIPVPRNTAASFTTLLIIVLALMTFLPRTSAAISTEDSDAIFNYAEASYPQFISPSGATSLTAGLYYFRYYPGTSSYIATAYDPATADWLSVSLGLLEGSLNFSGPYPAIAQVSYQNSSNVSVTVRAYSGQVALHFDVSATYGGTATAALLARETIISANGGTVIGKIPLVGFYLVSVQAGQENGFIQALQNSGYGVDVAVPNGAAARGDSPVLIDNACWLSTCTQSGATPASRYVPLNVGSGVVVLDDFNDFAGSNHGDDVYTTAVNNGGNVSTKVQLPVSSDGSVPNDKIVASVVAIQQGASLFAPGQNVITNLSFNAGGEGDEWYPEYWHDLASMVDSTMKSVNDQLPADQQDRFLLVQEIGNSGQDVSTAFGTVYSGQTTMGLTDNHLYVGGSDGTYATQVSAPNYHDKVAWYPGTIRPGVFGSSFASPAVAAFIDQVARQADIPLAQAKSAVMQALTANPSGTPTQIIAAAVATVTTPANSITPTSQAFTAAGGNGNVTVTVTASQGWTAASNASWITVLSGHSGLGNGTVLYAVAANTASTTRTGTITIAGQTLGVTQAGSTGVTGYWSGTMSLPGAAISGCQAETVYFSLSLTEDASQGISGYTSNDRTITSGSRSGNSITVTLDTMFGARGPYTWTWNGTNTISGSMAYFCYSLDTGALLSEGTETFSVSPD